jgi:hypothetical protein
MPLTKVQSGMIGSVDATTLTGVVPAANGGTGGTGGAIGFKNRLINGNFAVSQYNAGTYVTASGYFIDRWRYPASQASKFTVGQNLALAPVTPPAGFAYYIGFQSASAYSMVANDYFGMNQFVEGYNMADLAWGTASAKTVTLSFWARSSLTGTFGGAIRTGDSSNYSYPFSYSLPTANTWTYITITIPGPTAGTWNTSNGQGLDVWFSLGTGSTYSGTADTWAAANYVNATGSVNVVSTNGALWYATGVQLEVGTAATNFDVRSFGTELALCQRYCNIFYGGTYGSFMISGSTFALNIAMPVSMRTQPTFLTNISDSNFVVAGPSSSQWAMYIQNSGYNSYSGSINTLSINSTPFNNYNWVQIGTYGCTLNSFTAFLLGSTRFFSFTAEL